MLKSTSNSIIEIGKRHKNEVNFMLLIRNGKFTIGKLKASHVPQILARSRSSVSVPREDQNRN